MTLHRKAALVMVLTTMAIAVASLLVAKTVLIPGLLRHEEQSVLQRVETLDATVERGVLDLDQVATDYANWNRTYEFMLKTDSDYARTEVNDASFEKYDVQLVMLIGLDDRLTLRKTFKVEGEAEVEEAEVAAIREATHEFIATVRDEVGVSGIVQAKSAAFIVVMRPILRSGALGPSRGMFVMARRIDGNELDYIRHIVHAPVTVIGQKEADRTRARQGSTPLWIPGTQAWFVRHAETVVAYLQLLDVEGRPAGALALTADREGYLRSRRMIWLSAGLVAGTSILLGLGKLWFLQALILSRLRRASQAVHRITAANDLSIRVPITRNDELGQLAGALNAMLEELERSRNELLAMHAAVEFEAMHDLLTGLKNRRAILMTLQVELTRAAREGTKLAVMLADIDHFKQINDQYGHPAGDAVLTAVAIALDSELRPYDATGRYGGEEFLIVVPGVSHVRAMEVADRLRRRVEQIKLEEINERPVTVSIGVTVTTGDESLEAVVEAADTSLYAAKRAGRNRVEMVIPPAPEVPKVAVKEYSGA